MTYPRPTDPSLEDRPDGPIHVRVRNLHKSYGDHEVLKGISFDVYRGATNFILGESGCGKTVLLRQLLRIERPDAGEIVVDGRDIVPLDELELTAMRTKFGVVFQDSALFDSLTVYENVAFPLRERERGLSERLVRERVEDRLRTLGVLDAARKLPGELSGGMRKRVAVARAMVANPEILVYDEPTRGLDPMLSRAVDELIDTTRKRFGVTSIVISHDIKSLIGIGHYVTLLGMGTVEWSSDLAHFLESTKPRVRAFLRASGVALGEASQVARLLQSGLACEVRNV